MLVHMFCGRVGHARQNNKASRGEVLPGKVCTVWEEPAEVPCATGPTQLNCLVGDSKEGAPG